MKYECGFWWPDGDSPDVDGTSITNIRMLDPRGGVAVDAGANVGVLSKFLAKRFEKVYAIECAPNSLECLRRNITEPNVEIIRGAVGRVGRYGVNVASRSTSTTIGDGDDAETIDIPEADFIKLDVEGQEWHAVQRYRWANRPLWMIEEKEYRVGRENLEVMREFMARKGYTRMPLMRPDVVYLPEQVKCRSG